jgi:hypothetical protein
MDRTFVSENQIERERLFELTAKLTDESMAVKLSNGWSVSDTLAHLAFWDFYCLSLLTGWEKSGFTAKNSSVEATNDAVVALGRAIPAPAVIQLVRDAAVATDRKAEEIAPELALAITEGGQSNFLRRSVHRHAHLNRIERELEL